MAIQGLDDMRQGALKGVVVRIFFRELRSQILIIDAGYTRIRESIL